MIKRSVIYLILAFSFFLLPWWFSLLFLLIFSYLVSEFYEAPLILFLLLILFTDFSGIWILIYSVLLTALVFILEEYIKPAIA